MMRLRWRLHGAWMWPTFLALTLVDGLLVHWLPVSGDHQSLVGGLLLGALLGLGGIVLVGTPAALLLRRIRRDMPKVVARDYAGTAVLVAISVALVIAGAVHHGRIAADRRALEDAVARAIAFIGDRAPDQFRRNLSTVDAYELQPPQIYRVCVRNAARTKSYCVVVDRAKPFARSVTTAGSEPNQVLSEGTS